MAKTEKGSRCISVQNLADAVPVLVPLQYGQEFVRCYLGRFYKKSSLSSIPNAELHPSYRTTCLIGLGGPRST